MKLLHIIASPRGGTSNTLPIALEFLGNIKTRYPDLEIEEVDLFKEDLPAVAGENMETKYNVLKRQPIDKSHQASWNNIENMIKKFLSADIYLISAPMWNFSIPYVLKYYIDAIVQPGYLFKFNEQGQPVGLVHGKQMVVVTSRGGDYSAGSPFNAYDFQETYLRAIFGYVGITDIQFVHAQPMDIGPEIRKAALANALEQVRGLANTYSWAIN